MDSLRYAPKELRESLEIQAEAINAPRIGTDDNFAYPTMQLNFAGGWKQGIGTSMHATAQHIMMTTEYSFSPRQWAFPRKIWEKTS